MKRLRLILIFACVLMVISGVPDHSSAHDDHHHHVTDATPLASPVANTGTGAVYLRITNNGDAPDRLDSATTDAAQTVEMHGMEMDGDVMRMTPMPDGLEIPAGETVTLEPQGGHLMLVNLNHDLRPGSTFRITLVFEQAGEVDVEVLVDVEAPQDSAPVTVGEITIDQVWSIPAPMIDGIASDSPATPVATPGN